MSTFPDLLDPRLFPTVLLPDRPDLDQLRRQAKDLKRAHARGDAAAVAEAAARLPGHRTPLSLAEAQCVIARRHSFRSWPRLVSFSESWDAESIAPAAQRLRVAMDGERLAEIRRLLADDPELVEAHVARMKRHHYKNHRPVTYAAERNLPAVVAVLLEHGADAFADGALAFSRAALHDSQLPVLRLLLDHARERGVQVADFSTYGWGPLLLTPCECLAPALIRFLVERGADPHRADPAGRTRQTPWQAVFTTYTRSPQRHDGLRILLTGAPFDTDTPVMDVHCRRLDRLAERLRADPGLVHSRFADPAKALTGMRGLDCEGATLLHVAAEYGEVEIARLLLDAGAEVDARAAVDARGRGGQTPLFHAASQLLDWGVPMARLLLERGASRTVVATVRGHYDQPDHWFTGTAVDYAAAFPPPPALGEVSYVRLADEPMLRLLRGS